MSRHAEGPASRGSQKWLQAAVNERPHVLDHALAGSVATPVAWVSPLADDDFAEYRDGDALKRLGLDRFSDALQKYWPRRGPQWDGLGIAADGCPVLVEAKAHIGELTSGPSRAGPSSLPAIEEALESAARWFGSTRPKEWNGRYYQYANRLAHLYFLTELNGCPARLVFLYFCGDRDMRGPTRREDWLAGISDVHQSLGIHSPHVQVVEAFVDVEDLVT